MFGCSIWDDKMNLRNQFHCEGPAKDVLKNHLDIIDTQVLKEMLKIIKQEIDRRLNARNSN